MSVRKGTRAQGAVPSLTVSANLFRDLALDRHHALPAAIGVQLDVRGVHTGSLIGVLVGASTVYAGRTDPHVTAVMALMERAKADNARLVWDKMPKRYDQLLDIGGTKYSYRLTVKWVVYPGHPDPYVWQQGAVPTWEPEFTCLGPGGGRAQAVKPISVGRWGAAPNLTGQ